MTNIEIRSVVVERELPHPPEKLWRALTQPHLIEQWLMKNDFRPAVGHRFKRCPRPPATAPGGPDPNSSFLLSPCCSRILQESSPFPTYPLPGPGL